MDAFQATMAGILIAREILQLINAGKTITEEQLSVLIASNLLKLNTTITKIREQMKQYGMEVK